MAMDASKLKNKRWTALVPQRQLLGRSGRPIQSSLHRPARLIGRLPEEAYVLILVHAGLSDIVSLACACRKLAALSTDERVWRVKLGILDWKGDSPLDAQKLLEKREGKKRESIDGLASSHPPAPSSGLTPSSSLQPKTTHPLQTPSSPPKAVSSKRTSIASTSASAPFESVASSSPILLGSRMPMLDDDDGFGDFVDFTTEVHRNGINGPERSSTTAVLTPSNISSKQSSNVDDPFSEVSLYAEPLQPSRTAGTLNAKQQDEDLLMMFDDGVEDIGMSHATPSVASSSTTPKASTFEGSRRDSVQVNGSLSAPPSSTSYQSPALSRDLFMAYYRYLIPYYVSLQYQSTSSLVFTQNQLSDLKRAYILTNLKTLISNKEISPTQYKTKSITVSKNLKSSIDYFKSYIINQFEKANNNRIISEMRRFALPCFALDKGNDIIQIFTDKIDLFNDRSWDPLSNLTKTFDTTGQLVDGIDFSAMDTFMNHVINVVQKEGTTIARVFPAESDALVYFTDRIANDVISDYIIDLLGAAHNLTNPLFLLTTAATFGQCQRLIDTVLNIEPKSPVVNSASVSKVVYEMFRPHTKDYLKEEPEWCRTYLEEICVEWEKKLLEERRNRDPTFLNTSNPQMAKRNILAGFTKALLLPVTIVPKTVALSVNAITQGSTMAFNAMTGTFSSSSTMSSSANGISTPKAINAPSSINANLRNGSSTPPLSTPPPASSLEQKTFPGLHGESFQSLISIETAMQLIQADRECLKRVQTFAGYTGEVGLRVKRVIEEIFVILCQTVSANHLTPAFAKATEQMGKYKPADHPVDESVAPLVQFFELVHIGDTILQMVQVYFDKEMKLYVDKNDFLSTIVREKKKFENSLDESVASGLNAGVNILMTQAEYILQSQQEPYDFCPEMKDGRNSSISANGGIKGQTVIDIEGPTKAAEGVVDCLKSHCQMLKGSTDKAILEVFHQEVGLRLHGMLLKHLKKSIVSISGGFQVIADLNLYTSFINSLKLPNVNPYFTALKMAANVFIIDSPKDLGMMARDLERYEGTLRIEDIMEMVQCRIDWKKIEREVEKEVFGFKTEDCIIA